MISQHKISHKIFKDLLFTKEEQGFIDKKFEKISLKKGDVLLNPNNFITNQYYVESGCLRSYFINSLGKDYTTQFAVSDWWISDYISYFNNEKSIMSIECIKDAIVYKISRKNMDVLCERFPQIERFLRRKLENAFASFQKRILDYLSLPARERYIQFVAKNPLIIDSVRNYHIASYLGITTESLSRIRKSIH